MNPSGAIQSAQTTEEDALRAHMYRFVGHLLARPPGGEELKLAAGMSGDESDLGKCVRAFAHIAGKTSPEQVAQEYQDLFIGVGRGEPSTQLSR